MGVAVSERLVVLRPPEYVEYAGQSVRCGGAVYRALQCLLRCASGRVTVARFQVAVWGRGRTVPPETLRGVVWRVNNLMKGLGCPLRAGLDDGQILFG